ncbi:MAG: hypothetical protein WCY11_19270, partial [Novosphingobium sp.]
MRRIIAATLAAAAFVTAPTPALADSQISPAMEAALSQANRADDRARDAFRHPAQTLAFFGVEPGMTVVDYMPAGGWYTRVLVPYLGKSGRYIGLMPDPAAAQAEGNARYFAALPAKFAEASPKWNLSGAPVSAYVSSELPGTLQGKVD